MTDREKTIKEMNVLRNWLLHMEEFNAHGNGDMYHEFGCTVYSALELLKEQELGHWIFLKNCSNSGVYCSECNTKVFDSYPFKKKHSYFCPHCGTRMEGEIERR